MLSGRRLREPLGTAIATPAQSHGGNEAMAFAEMNRLQQQLGLETQCLQRYQQAMLALQEGRRLPWDRMRHGKTVKNTEVVIGTERGFAAKSIGVCQSIFSNRKRRRLNATISSWATGCSNCWMTGLSLGLPCTKCRGNRNSD